MERPDVDRAIAILRRDNPQVVESLRRVLSCTMDQEGRTAVNDLFTTVLSQTLRLEHKKLRAAASMKPRCGLYAAQGFMSLNHCPDVLLLRTLCEIAEIPHVTTATTEWLDKMEARG